jgi:hypothetical protein
MQRRALRAIAVGNVQTSTPLSPHECGTLAEKVSKREVDRKARVQISASVERKKGPSVRAPSLAGVLLILLLSLIKDRVNFRFGRLQTTQRLLHLIVNPLDGLGFWVLNRKLGAWAYRGRLRALIL